MRTSQTLLNAKTYLNGSPVYQGDPSRVYTSSLITSVNVAIVKSPEGGKVMTQSDEQLNAAMHKLKFGQIGAVKSGVTVSSSETVIEILTPVTMEKVITVKDALIAALSLESYMKKKQCTINGKPMTIEEIKGTLAQYRDKNREIRDAWSSKSKLMRQRGASSDEIVQQKKASYAEYVSVSTYTIAVSLSVTHYVHKPSLKGVVVDNCSQEQYNAFNYKEGNTRKVASQRLPIVSIPILNLGDRDELLKMINALAATERLKGVTPNLERLIIEGSPFNELKVDFDVLRKHDNSIIAIKA